MPTAKEVKIGKRVAAPPGGRRGAAWNKTKQQQESLDQRRGMSGAGDIGVGMIDRAIYQLPYYSRHSNMESWNKETAKLVSHT